MDPLNSLHRSDGCSIDQASGYLRGRVGPGLAHQVQECYRTFVNECLQRHSTRALIVGTASVDAFYHLALRDALRSMSVAGLPDGFRLALIAGTPDLIAIYDAALVEAGRHGIEARRFLDEADGQRWLAES
jgi:hypothetical protein